MTQKVLFLLLLLPFICSEGLSQSRIFWADARPSTIRSAWLNGTHVETVKELDVFDHVIGMVLDHEHGYAYWTEYPLKMHYGRLHRFPVDGSGLDEHIFTPEWTEGGLAIDYDEDKIYWATRLLDMNRVTIMRANLDGSLREEIAPNASVYCKGLAIDPVGRNVYWTTNETILRADLDTGAVEDVGPDPYLPPYPGFDGDISIDVQARKMYWTRKGNRSSSGWVGLFRADLDGRNVEKLWEETYSDAGDIVVDGINKYVYWTQWTLMADPGGVYIRRARTDQPVTWATIENIVGPPDTPTELTTGIDLFLDPGAPVLESPVAEAQNVSTTTELRWSRVTCSPRYDLQVASDSAFGSIVYRTNTPHQEDTFAAPVARHRYWWRVHSNACGIASHWSNPRWFEVGATGPLAPTLVKPEEGETTGLSVEFTWNPGPDAAHHRFQLATVDDFSSTIVDEDSLSTTAIDVEDLISGQSYYWRVGGVDAEGRYTFAVPQVFTVSDLPSEISLVQPADNQVEVSAYTLFEWNPLDDADSYRFELSSTTDFAAILVDTVLSSTTFELTTPLAYAQKHTWRVCGINIAGEGPWSTRSFTVAVGTATESLGEIPMVTRLGHAYPNPADQFVHFPIELANSARVTLVVHDMFGRRVATLVDDNLGAGRYAPKVDIFDLASGAYVAVLEAGDVRARRMFTVVR